jgi:pilus assembly protein CpaC
VVGSDTEADIAARLAGVYSKEIVNSLVVDPRHRPQVQLKVRFAELDRSKLDAFGINLFGLNSQNIGSGSTQQYSAPVFQTNNSSNSVQVSDFLNLFYFNLKNGVGASLKDLQSKGVLEILAEPTLMTIDGQTAKFLAGGEFPFPVVQPGSAGGTATVTIQFRQFGVKLEFTPYVNPDGTIRLKVMPEVSALDYSNVVVIAGYTIPSLTTRKAETEVELRDGQTFGISGILDHRTTDSLNKMPGIGDIPILGQLFRSKSLNHSVMELVVVVTPTIVDPLTSDQAPPANPKWVTPPGQLGTFDKGLPKSYNQQP